MANIFESTFMTLKNGMTMYFADSKARQLIDKLKALVDTKYGPDNPPPSTEGGRVWYATCSTAAGTAAKEATSSTGDFVLATGSMVRILFSNSNNQTQPTLSVDGSTAKRIKNIASDTNITTNLWRAGEVIDVVYDGTQFVVVDGGLASTAYYGRTILSNSTSSASQTTAATSKAVKDAYDLANGKCDRFQFQIPAGHTVRLTMEYGNEVSFLLASTGFNINIRAGLWHIAGYHDSTRTEITNLVTAGGITITPGAAEDSFYFDISNSTANTASITLILFLGSVSSATDVT